MFLHLGETIQYTTSSKQAANQIQQFKIIKEKTMKKYILFIMGILCALFSLNINAEETKRTDANVVGHVIDKKNGDHLPFITVAIKGTTLGTMTDISGHFTLNNLPIGEFDIVASAVGYKSQTYKITTKRDKTLEVKFQLEEDMISLEDVVVTANRNETLHKLAPTLVNVVSAKVFDQTCSSTLSQGLNFQPGVRMENDCQNCGFSQVRINGMEGKYTQILINSRAIFSSLAGVYGLEQIPANMIERVEVVRGGGSALFGSSAIAGTVNIITKEPMRNSGSVGHSISKFDNSNAFDNNTTMNLSLVSDDRQMGAYVYAQNRERNYWDKNGDGFSELPQLKNQSLGINAFYRTSPYSKLNIEYHHMNEFRRGGSGFGLAPHIACDSILGGVVDENGNIAPGYVEQIEHSINTGSITFSGFSKNQKHNYSIYASAQNINRNTYYGAYGRTKDLTAIMGGQYMCKFDRMLFMPSDFTLGVEYSHDDLKDRATDYNKYLTDYLSNNNLNASDLTTFEKMEIIKNNTPAPLNQKVDISSAYFQNEWKNEQWSLLLGGRVDKNSLLSKAIFSPRANIRYNPTKNISMRISYAEGFRAPQAFDEDLHVSNVGGDLVSIVLDKNLKEERSHSYNASIDWYKSFGDIQMNLLAEGFYTDLKDPFVLSELEKDPKLTNRKIQTRYNGSGAKVYGGTFEGKIAYRNLLQLQAGITCQRSLYDEAEVWGAGKLTGETDENGDDVREDLADKHILKTPDVYGYFTASITPIKPLMISFNGNYTGSMYVPHLLTEVYDKNETDVLIKSPTFFEFGTKVSYDIDFSSLCMQLSLGVQNMFNSYQKDFDKGANRDSGYMYGPNTPRTYYASMKLSF